MSFNFSKTESATAGNFLKPGIYKMKVVESKEGIYEESKIPYVDITFESVEDSSLKLRERFNLVSKKEDSNFDPLSRLQYLHEAWSGKKLDKDFKTAAEIAAYFKKAFVNVKAGSRNIIIGGEISGSLTYGRLPLAGFIAEDDATLEEFEEGGDLWKKYVRVSTRKTESTGRTNGILNDVDTDSSAKTPGTKKKEDEKTSDDLPW